MEVKGKGGGGGGGGGVVTDREQSLNAQQAATQVFLQSYD